MERVAFLLDETGERISCLLNPETIVLKRRAGVRWRSSSGGLIAGMTYSDDQVLFTGGGSTVLELDLVFDVSLAGTSVVSEDVRDITGLIWKLTENDRLDGQPRRPPRCRFVWGKKCNMPGIVTALAERLEDFSLEGIPRRSWLRLRLLRLADEGHSMAMHPTLNPGSGAGEGTVEMLRSGEHSVVYQVTGAGAQNENGTGTSERLDQIAYRLTNHADNWHDLALENDISDPWSLTPGMTLVWSGDEEPETSP